MTRDQLISLFFLALLAFVVYQVGCIFSIFYTAIFWAGILAFGFHPLYQKLLRALEKKELLAAALMTALVFLVVVPPVVLMTASLTNQALEVYQSVSSYIREGGLEKLIDQIRTMTFVQKMETQFVQWEPLKKTTSEWLVTSARAVGNFGVAQAGTITKNFFVIILNMFLTFVLLFVFLLDGQKIFKFLYRIAPLEEKNKKYIFNQINETFSAVIRGQLLTSLTQALLAGTVFWILRLPAPLFVAAATFFATMIPIVGASFVWMPFVLFLMMAGDYLKASLLFILGVLVISLADNILKPALIGEKTKLPYFLLFFGVMGGIKLYGLMGIFIAPVVLSLFFALTKIYQEKYSTNSN